MSQKNNIYLEVAKIKNLPPLPEESIRIITAVNDPDISVDELVDVLSLSPVLMARLLGLANSAYFGRAGKISDLRIAIIQVLGLNLVKSLALSIVLNVEMDTSKCKSFDPDFFWSHALITALIAQKLSVHLDDERMTPSIVYTSGLLLNIGLLAAVYIFPEQINDIFASTDRTEDSVSKQMRDTFGLTQYELGAMLLERWQLPSVYQSIVKEFKQAGFKGEEKHLTLLIELSHRIGLSIANDNHSETHDVSGLLDRLSISEDILDKVIVDMVNNIDNIKELAKVISG